MDMKRILQAIDGVATKPVVGVDSMSRFLRIVKETDAPTEIMSLPASIKATEAVGDFTADPKQQASRYVQYHSGLYDPSTLPPFMTITPNLQLAVQPPTNNFKGTHAEILANMSAANKRLPKELQIGWDELKQLGGVSDTIELTGEPHPDKYNPAADPTDPNPVATPFKVQENNLSKFLSIIDKNNSGLLSEAIGDPANVLDQVNSYIQFSSGLYQKSMSSIEIKKGLVLPITFKPLPPSGDSAKLIQANINSANARLPKELQLPPDQLSAIIGGADQAYSGPKSSDPYDGPMAENTAPAQPQVDPAHYQVPSIDFLKKNNAHPSDVISGAQPSTTDPTRIGSWQAGSDFDDLMMALNGSYYQARKADPNYKQPAFVKDDWELVQRMLGTPEGKEYAIANWIGLSNINDTSPDAEFNRAQHKEFEKQANAKLMQQPDGVVTPGWKYDQKLGMTPAQAALQAQKTQPATVQETMGKFLSIVKKNDVGILNEGANPHKVALPVQMAMQHYQKEKPVHKPVGRETTIGKYFHKVEEEIAEEKANRRQLMNQYASVIAERVLMKENNDMANRLPRAGITVGPGPQGNLPDGGHLSLGETPIAMDPAEPNNPLIHSHEKANPMTLKGRIMSARAQLKELAQLAERDDLLAWEEICKKSKGGMFMGLEQNLEQIRHGIEQLAATRRKGGVNSRGIDKSIGESMSIKEANALVKTVKPKKKTSTCRAGQVQTGVQSKDGMTVPKCSVVKKGF